MNIPKIDIEQLELHYHKEALLYYGQPNATFVFRSVLRDIITQQNILADAVNDLRRKNHGNITPQQRQQSSQPKKGQPRSSGKEAKRTVREKSSPEEEL